MGQVMSLALECDECGYHMGVIETSNGDSWGKVWCDDCWSERLDQEEEEEDEDL